MKDRLNCKIASKCGGCRYTACSYQESLKAKEKAVSDLLRRFAVPEPIVGMPDPFHYRNKVHHVFVQKKDGTVTSGFYEEGTRKVVPAEACLLEDSRALAVINTIERLVRSFRYTVYDEFRKNGLFRHVLVRTAHSTGEILVVLVLTSPILPGKNDFVKALIAAHPEITTVVLNVNGRNSGMVLGNTFKILYGPGFIRDRLRGLSFTLSPSAFYQVNSRMTEKLYAAVAEFADLTGRETVIDAYSGIGTIGLSVARSAGRVIGIELNPAAVKDAVRNARQNRIENARFFTGDAGDFLVKMAAAGEKADVVLMDPPRSGATETFMDAVIRMAPEKVIYVSCNPETLARDLDYFSDHGYAVKRLRPYDMFCWTEHVETVVQISKGTQPAKYVRVEFNLEEMDMSGFQYGASYKKIQKWIEEKYGFHVSDLNIA